MIERKGEEWYWHFRVYDLIDREKYTVRNSNKYFETEREALEDLVKFLNDLLNKTPKA